MNKKLKASMIIAVVLGIITGIIYAFTPTPPRHVDPKLVAEEAPSPIELLQLYSNIAELIIEFNFTKAKENLLKAYEVYVPPNLRYIITRFNDLLNQVIDLLNETKKIADTVEAFIRIAEYDEALKLVGKGLGRIVRARIIYDELMEAARMFSKLRIPLTEFNKILNSIKELIDGLEEKLRNLEEVVKKYMIKVIDTKLYISVEPHNITIGQPIKIEGLLETEHEIPLQNKTIIIHVGSATIKTETNIHGLFKINCTVKSYSKKIKVYAEYIPSGEDVEKYGHSRSNIEFIYVYFITPKLNAWLSTNKVRPSENTTLYIESLPGLEVAVDSPFIKTKGLIPSTGKLSIPIKIPENTAKGLYQLIVKTIPKGIIGPNSTKLKIEVYKSKPNVELTTPSVVFTGILHKLTIKSNITATAKISIDELESSSIDISGNKIIEYTFIVPHSYLGTSLNLLIEVKPKDPRYDNVILVASIPTYNTIMVITSITFITSILIVYILLREEPLPKITAKTPLQPEIGVGKPIEEVEDELSPIRGLFHKLVLMIRVITGIYLEKHYTLREYLAKLHGKLPQRIHNLIKDLILCLEAIIYGRVETRGLLIEKVKAMLKEILAITHRLKGGEGGK